VGIEYFVRKLREAVLQSDTLKSRSWGFFHLLAAAIRATHQGNPRIENLIAILKNSLAHAIAELDTGKEPGLEKIIAVLDAIEFQLDKFSADHG
jgi:hypothetical protein